MKKPKVKPYKIDQSKLKPKRRKGKKHVRSNDHMCPNCFSKLIVDEVGNLTCSGDKLKLWKEKIEDYDKMNIEEKQQFLTTIDNKGKFIEWYNLKEDLQCNWNNKVVTEVPTYNVTIPDPMIVGKIEKSLGRPLTEEELEEGFVFWRRLITENTYEYSNHFYRIDMDDFEEYHIPRRNFPDDF